MQLREAVRKSFAPTFCVSFADSKSLSRTLPSNQLKWRFSARRCGARPHLVSVIKCGNEANTLLAQSERLRTLRDAVRFLEEPMLTPTPASPSRCLNYRTQPSSRSSSTGLCGRSMPVHRNEFGFGATSIRRTGSKWSRPMPNRNFGEPTTPSSWAVRWNSFGYPPPRTLRGLRPAHPVWATRAAGALLRSSSETC